MEDISLNGLWKASSEFSTELEFVAEDLDDAKWPEIRVPSHWQEHERFRDYPEKLVFRKKFDYPGIPPGARAFLSFKGVFYFARVWLNGQYLGEHTGYFAPFRFDVTDALREGQNQLAVFVRCEWEKDINDKRQIIGVFAHWDCKSDDIQPGGIWNDVEIVHEPQIYVERLSIGNFLISSEDAEANVVAVVGGLGSGVENLVLEWTIHPATFEGDEITGRVSLAALNEIRTEVSFEVLIPNPRLWWTWDHGAPDLYALEVRLLNGAESAAEAAKTWKKRFGIRTVEFENWQFKLNGRRIFLRGSNYAPADVRLASANRENYERDIDLMRGANCNMLRVHAHVEKSEFYDACDERGVLIWQDFPLQWYYSEDMEEEGVSQIKGMVRMLESHPCVAVWCCHNEPMLYQRFAPAMDIIREGRVGDYIAVMRTLIGPNQNKKVLDRKLFEAASEADPYRPVVIYSGEPSILGDGTDSHLYFGWYFGSMRGIEMLKKISKKSFRFITEYGAQSFPPVESFRKIQNVDSLDALDWVALERENMLQKSLMDKFVPVKAGATLEEYIDNTQWYQARVVKYHNELFRVMKYRPCGGALHFMSIDCCPGITWAVVDYWRRPKRAYHALAESFRPLHVLADFPRRRYRRGTVLSLRVYVVNDMYRRFENSKVRWCITDAANGVQAEGVWTKDIEEDSIDRIGRAHWETSGAAPGGYALLLELETSEGTISNQYEFEIRK